ncbi:MAG: bifunctional 5,10-methylenetetrahydrofolate dehydrogenase/5,10-methenyltetrahydrofolate cyclohydrolase [Candidatus Limnocylindrales bacterium]
MHEQAGAPRVNCHTTCILAGGPIAVEIRARVRADVLAFRRRHGSLPTLAVLHVGRGAEFAVYARQIVRTCERVGIVAREERLAGRASAAGLRERLRELSSDPGVTGVILQLPLPRRISLRAVVGALDPAKDVDGITPLNAGLLAMGYPAFAPATAQAAAEILDRSGRSLEGLHAVVIGRSNVVGRPVAQLLLRRHCTVTICHTRTRDLGSHTRQADVLVVAAGSPGLVRGDMLKPGATVVDVGTTVVDGRIVGDVDVTSAAGVAGVMTPVPGGVGPVTNAVLMEHVMLAARNLAAAERARRPQGVCTTARSGRIAPVSPGTGPRRR